MMKGLTHLKGKAQEAWDNQVAKTLEVPGYYGKFMGGLIATYMAGRCLVPSVSAQEMADLTIYLQGDDIGLTAELPDWFSSVYSAKIDLMNRFGDYLNGDFFGEKCSNLYQGLLNYLHGDVECGAVGNIDADFACQESCKATDKLIKIYIQGEGCVSLDIADGINSAGTNGCDIDFDVMDKDGDIVEIHDMVDKYGEDVGCTGIYKEGSDLKFINIKIVDDHAYVSQLDFHDKCRQC